MLPQWRRDAMHGKAASETIGPRGGQPMLRQQNRKRDPSCDLLQHASTTHGIDLLARQPDK